MTISDVQVILHGTYVCGEDQKDREIHSACGSDMMSDVLAFVKIRRCSSPAFAILRLSGPPR